MEFIDNEKLKAIQVEIIKAKKIKKILIKKNLLKVNYKIYRDKKYVYFPIKKLPDNFPAYKITEKKFKKKKYKPKSYKEIVKIPYFIFKELPTSYDIIGDIIQIKLSDKLYQYKKKIGDALLQVNTNINTVCIVCL